MTTTAAYDLEGIIAALDRHRQRATYGAVAALLDTSPRGLMHNRARGPGNSWIVAKANGLPTGYVDAEMHPDLTANAAVLSTREELAAWIVDRTA